MTNDIDLSQVKWDAPQSGIDLSQVKWDSQPADANLGKLQFQAKYPIFKAAEDTAKQSVGSFVKGAYGATSMIPGIKELLSPVSLNGSQFGPDFNKVIQNMNTTPDKVPQGEPFYEQGGGIASQVAQWLGSAIPTMAMANPLVRGAGALPLIGNTGKLGLGGITPAAVGFGALEGGKAALQGQPIAPAVAQGAISGASYGIGGKIGSTVADRIANPLAKAIGGTAGEAVTRYAPNVGTAAGMATAGALGASPDQKIPSAILGAGFGLASPMSPIAAQNMTTVQHEDLIDQYANNYRDVINPTKGVIQKTEIKSGKDLDDAFKLMAREGIVINKDVENKLDTRGAVEQIKPKISALQDQLNNTLASDKHKQFDLEDLRNTAKEKLTASIKNAEDLDKSHAQVDNAIDAEIARNGQFVNGSTLNNIKQGFWSKSYDPMAPNSNSTARQIGNVAKSMIEEGYPQEDVQNLNKAMGKYLDLKSILEASHGNVVQKGKMGRYFIQGMGALAGHASGIPGAEIAGSLVAGKGSDFINDPARITGAMANRIKGVNIIDRPALESKRNGTAYPEMLNPLNRVGITNQQRLLTSQFNPIMEAASPQNKPIIPPAPVAEETSMPINMPNPIKGLPFEPTHPPYTAPDQSVFPPNPGLNQNIPKPPSKGLSPNAPVAFGAAAALGIGSLLNPLNAQAQTVKEPERLQLPGNEYTKKKEGFQAHPYIDSMGIKHIGYGFNMGAVGDLLPKLVREGKRPLTRDEADKIYTKLYANARNAAQNFAGDNWHSLNGQQQKALADMAYQMSGKINGFKKLKQAIENMDFHTASNEIMNSAYANQAKNRASRNAALIAMK